MASSTSFRQILPDTSSTIRDREAAESLMQLRQGLFEEMHRKKIAATFSTQQHQPVTTSTLTTSNSTGSGIVPQKQQQQQQERSSVIVIPNHHQQVPISVLKPTVEGISSRSGGLLERDESFRKTQKNAVEDSNKILSVPSSSSQNNSPLIFPLGTLARNELQFKSIELDLDPLPSKGNKTATASSQQVSQSIEVNSASLGAGLAGSYPKKKDLYNRSPPLNFSSSSAISNTSHKYHDEDNKQSFNMQQLQQRAVQQLPEQSHNHNHYQQQQQQLGMPSNVSSIISEQQQQNHQKHFQDQQQRLVASPESPSWLPFSYRPVNLGPLSSSSSSSQSHQFTILPGTRIIRLSDAVAAQQLGRNYYGPGGDLEWRQPRQGMFENNRLKQIKSKKKVFRALIQINGDTSQPIVVDNFTIQREAWAKAFLQTQICHSAAILFKAIFTPDEIQNCTLAGRNGTNRLDLKKRAAIFRAVGWMKNKNQNPYSFDSSKPSSIEYLTDEEKMMIEKKVFVERRYQTSRKIKPNSERVSSSMQLKRPASSMVDTQQRQIIDSLKMYDNSIMSHEPISPSALLEIDMKPSIIPLPNMMNLTSSTGSSHENNFPNMSNLNIKQEKEDEPNTGSEEEDPFMKLSSNDEQVAESLPPKVAKMSTQ